LGQAIDEATKKMEGAGLCDFANSLVAAWQHLSAPDGKWMSQYSAQLVRCKCCRQGFPSKAALMAHVQRELQVAAFMCMKRLYVFILNVHDIGR
jgi:hypothetical protein